MNGFENREVAVPTLGQQAQSELQQVLGCRRKGCYSLHCKETKFEFELLDQVIIT